MTDQHAPVSPWNANEAWEYGKNEAGKCYAKVTGRIRCPAKLKLNPIWWFKNDYAQQVSDATWFHPDWPQAQRELYWNYFRNPLQNFRMFVIGWADRNYTVEVVDGYNDQIPGGNSAVLVQRSDIYVLKDGVWVAAPEKGYQKLKITSDDGKIRNFTSYCGSMFIWYWGTQPSGVFGAKFVPA